MRSCIRVDQGWYHHRLQSEVCSPASCCKCASNKPWPFVMGIFATSQFHHVAAVIGRHVQLISSRKRYTAIYVLLLCAAILEFLVCRLGYNFLASVCRHATASAACTWPYCEHQHAARVVCVSNCSCNWFEVLLKNHDLGEALH